MTVNASPSASFDRTLYMPFLLLLQNASVRGPGPKFVDDRLAPLTHSAGRIEAVRSQRCSAQPSELGNIGVVWRLGHTGTGARAKLINSPHIEDRWIANITVVLQINGVLPQLIGRRIGFGSRI